MASTASTAFLWPTPRRARSVLTGLVLVVLLGSGGCRIVLDQSNLVFADSNGAEEVIDEGVVQQDLACPGFVWCLADGNKSCSKYVLDGERAKTDQLDSCAAASCSVSYENPSDDGGAGFLRCLLEECPDKLFTCMSSSGESTCLAYAVKWQKLANGTATCDSGVAEECLVQALAAVSPSAADEVVSLLRCFADAKDGSLEALAMCLTACGD